LGFTKTTMANSRRPIAANVLSSGHSLSSCPLNGFVKIEEQLLAFPPAFARIFDHFRELCLTSCQFLRCVRDACRKLAAIPIAMIASLIRVDFRLASIPAVPQHGQSHSPPLSFLVETGGIETISVPTKHGHCPSGRHRDRAAPSSVANLFLRQRFRVLRSDAPFP